MNDVPHAYCQADGCYVQMYTSQCTACQKMMCTEHIPVANHLCSPIASNSGNTGAPSSSSNTAAASDTNSRSIYRRTRSREVSLGLGGNNTPTMDHALSLSSPLGDMDMTLASPDLLKRPSSDLLRRPSSLGAGALSRDVSALAGSSGPGGYLDRGLSLFGQQMPEYLRHGSGSGGSIPRQGSNDGGEEGLGPHGHQASPPAQLLGPASHMINTPQPKYTRSKSRELASLGLATGDVSSSSGYYAQLGHMPPSSQSQQHSSDSLPALPTAFSSNPAPTSGNAASGGAQQASSRTTRQNSGAAGGGAMNLSPPTQSGVTGQSSLSHSHLLPPQHSNLRNSFGRVVSNESPESPSPASPQPLSANKRKSSASNSHSNSNHLSAASAAATNSNNNNTNLGRSRSRGELPRDLSTGGMSVGSVDFGGVGGGGGAGGSHDFQRQGSGQIQVKDEKLDGPSPNAKKRKMASSSSGGGAAGGGGLGSGPRSNSSFDVELHRMDQVLHMLRVSHNHNTLAAPGSAADVHDTTDELMSAWRNAHHAYRVPDDADRWCSGLAVLSLTASERFLADSAHGAQAYQPSGGGSQPGSNAGSRSHSPSAHAMRASFTVPASTRLPTITHAILPHATRLLRTMCDAFHLNELELVVLSIYLDRIEAEWIGLLADKARDTTYIVRILHYVCYMVKSAFSTASISQQYIPYVTALYPDFSQSLSLWLHEKPGLQLALPPIILNHRFNLLRNFKGHA